MLPLSILVIALLALVAFAVGRNRAIAAAGGTLANLHSRPSYHGLYCFLWVAIIGFGVFIVVDLIAFAIIDSVMFAAIEEAAPTLQPIERALIFSDSVTISRGGIASTIDELRTAMAEKFGGLDSARIIIVSLAGVGAAAATFYKTYHQLDVGFRARNRSERILRSMLWVAATVAILTTIGIVLSLIGETLVFFGKIDWQINKFLFGTTWSPLSGVHTGDLDADKVGAIPLFVGTMLITIIAMLVAVPVGLFAAIYLADFASPGVRAWAKPLLEILAGIPTVVYGFFAAITVAPGDPQHGRGDRAERRLGIGAGRRRGDGDHDHPVHLLAVGRRDQRGAADPCATDPTGWARPRPRPCGTWCCRRRCRGSSPRCCWASAARSARR